MKKLKTCVKDPNFYLSDKADIKHNKNRIINRRNWNLFKKLFESKKI